MKESQDVRAPFKETMHIKGEHRQHHHAQVGRFLTQLC